MHDYHTTFISSNLFSERSTACDGTCMQGRLATHLPLRGLTETCCMQGSGPDDGDLDFLDCTMIHAHFRSSKYAMNSPGPLPQLIFPISPSQPSPGSIGSASGSVDRSQREPHLATQHVLRRGANSCNRSGMQCCQVHQAQASFKKSYLSHGFLSPWTCEGSSESMSSGHMKLTNSCVMAGR